jgi:hypothetical protein
VGARLYSSKSTSGRCGTRGFSFEKLKSIAFDIGFSSELLIRLGKPPSQSCLCSTARRLCSSVEEPRGVVIDVWELGFDFLDPLCEAVALVFGAVNVDGVPVRRCFWPLLLKRGVLSRRAL